MNITRRTVLASALAAGALSAFPLSGAAIAGPLPRQEPQPPREAQGPVPIRWLDGVLPAAVAGGVTWGVPWRRGEYHAGQKFQLATSDGVSVPVQTWETGWWPDGSIKWTAHAVSETAATSDSYQLSPGEPASQARRLRVSAMRGEVIVDTGVIRVSFARSGENVISSIRRGSLLIAKDGRLVASRQNVPSSDAPSEVTTEDFASQITEVTVEQDGPVRAVIKVEGVHQGHGRQWLPFTLRWYLYAGSDALRLIHTFHFDGDHHTDFINGIGVKFDVPMRGELHNRHIRLAGADGGIMREAVRPITGLRRDPGAEVKAAQVAGEATPDPSTWDQRVTSRLHWIPAFGHYRMSQLTANGFDIHKRTGPNQSWLKVNSGTRSAGTAFVGSPEGGLAFGMRNFWQLHPTELEIEGAAGDVATATVWMWSPRAGSMDMRPYHDGMGQDTHEKQLDALEITYEDHEPGFDTPYGVGRTSELSFWALPATPSVDRFAELAAAVVAPPMLMSEPEHNSDTGVFGSWTPVDRSVPAKEEIEDNLDFLHHHARSQIEQHSWYGFWDYGDIMHEYDRDRHTWRYDIGGYAWDNSELSTDLWLWYHYLRTGDAVAFRFAEAMTRHTSEVDTYHLGEWRGLGTRHGVQHWGDSAKQVRISNAGYRRMYYFLTADERTGDILRDLVDSDRSFLRLDPIRKIREEEYEPDPHAVAIGTGTDWGAIALAWLTEWERNGDPIAKTKLINSVRTIAALPNGWAQGGLITMDLDTGIYTGPDEPSVSIGSLGGVFGLIELMTELIDLIEDEQVEAKWVEFCRLYNATRDEQAEATGVHWGNLNLRQSYSRATAYAASRLGDETLALRGWQEFRTGHAGYPEDFDFSARRIEPPLVLNPVDEAAVSTNANAQYALAAFQCLALIGDHI